MALDGAFLRLLTHELQEQLLDCRVDKVHQLSREELVLILRSSGGNKKLYISAGADSPRIHLSQSSFENPKTPPMFCMLLRKHLSGAKLCGLEQLGLDRVLRLRFEGRDELGDLVELWGVLEIMGRHSNFILVDQDGRVIDALKRVDHSMSSVRPVLPGLRYSLPPAQDKLLLTDCDLAKAEETLYNGREQLLSKALLGTFQGLSPLVCRELSSRVFGGEDLPLSQLTEAHKARLHQELLALQKQLQNFEGQPCALLDSRGKPVDYSFLPIGQYGSAYVLQRYDSYSQLLDRFYAQRDLVNRMKHRGADLLKVVNSASQRVQRKLLLQEQELRDCAQRQQWKEYGDILSANLYSLEKGQREAQLLNFYDPEQPLVTIPLDPRKSPSQNAQKYYADYRKADTAEKMLRQLLEQGRQEADYLASVLDALNRATALDELAAIRTELEGQGYLRAQKQRGMKPQKLSPKEYRSDDGFTILVGRNNIQNDQLTLKDAGGRDIWFHTKNIPGSHTIVLTEGKEPPNSTLTQAAILAATNSQAADSSQVPVDYTAIRYVKKPRGAKPGMVIYTVYQTAYVTPDPALEARLRVK